MTYAQRSGCSTASIPQRTSPPTKNAAAPPVPNRIIPSAAATKAKQMAANIDVLYHTRSAAGNRLADLDGSVYDDAR